MYPQPTHIGRYEIKSRIGRGGMGDLYLALDPNTHRLVALKLLNATLDSTELRERFAREARALAALNHANIVNIYDTGEFDDSPFIVMEYVRGETLAELIKRRAALSVSQKLKLMEELCAGLAQAHEAGIIHRDIKPANLMVDQQGHLKILDFGIARVADGNRTRAGLPLTQVNVQIGTPGYMSPEQIEGGDVDHRSDIFAVGAVCYELLAYDEAFSGANTRQIESRVLRGQPRPLATLVPGLDAEIDDIILRALKADPNKRYQDAATFQRALERFRLRLEPDEPAAPQRATPPPPPGMRGKTREARAEAAYQRALAAYQGGSRDAAHRFAVEAIAEDPSHAGARALLGRLERRVPPIDVAPRSPQEPPMATAVGTSAADLVPMIAPGSTLVSGSTIASATLVSGSAVALDATLTSDAARLAQRTAGVASPPTILVTPPPARAPRRTRYESFLDRIGLAGISYRRAFEWAPARDRVSSSSQQPIWTRLRDAAPIAALVAVVVVVSALAMLVMAWLRPSGQPLTITRPIGGTLSGPGITCGSRAGDCTTRRPKGDAIELIAQADAGYELVAYTGDCAPGGRTVMSAARTCGATFEAVPEIPVETRVVLTITPPTGGTLEGIDILCGTKGSVCAAKHPRDVPVDLHPIADAGYTFMGFTGDCAPLGHTQMTGARTCGATFSPTASLAPAAPSAVVSVKRQPAASDQTARVTSRPPATDSTSTRPLRSEPVVPQDKPAVPPKSPDDFAKDAIKETLKQYCLAYEALDPAAVVQQYPTADMNVLQNQLNKSKYKSVQCTVGDPEFLVLDAAGGTAKVRVDVKQVFEHTAIETKPQKTDLVASMTFSRFADRTRWVIASARFTEKK